jgi:hypothetical protein
MEVIFLVGPPLQRIGLYTPSNVQLKQEKNSHPPIGLCEFDGFREVIERIEQLEELIKKGEPKSPLPYSGKD